jgi:hypothetical protein
MRLLSWMSFMFNKLLDKLYLLVLKRRLKRYRRDAKWYEDKNCYNDFYHMTGIPKLEKEIKELEEELLITRKKHTL